MQFIDKFLRACHLKYSKVGLLDGLESISIPVQNTGFLLVADSDIPSACIAMQATQACRAMHPICLEP